MRSPEWVCPVTKISNGRRKACDDYACECKVTATCPKGHFVSSCMCSNSNPLTPVDLSAPLAGSTPVVQFGAEELDMRYPWVLSSSFTPMSSLDGPTIQSVSECTCTWVNTIPLVRAFLNVCLSVCLSVYLLTKRLARQGCGAGRRKGRSRGGATLSSWY